MAYTTIDDPEAYFQTVIWTGNGTDDRSITLPGDTDLQPDAVWVKCRSNAHSHRLVDSIRGATKTVLPDDYNSEGTEANIIQAFESDGFQVGDDANSNGSSKTYVAWCWKESATAGFDMVSYSGTGSAKTEAHSLSAVPKMMIMKNRSSGRNWIVYHAGWASDPETDAMVLNENYTPDDDASYWNDTAPTSSVFTVGTGNLNNESGDNIIAYLWSEKQGFSKFGSYTGNGEADGAFIYTGFRPAFFMIKKSSATDPWVIFDNKRAPYNHFDKLIYPDSNEAESGAAERGDFLSNGVKFKSNHTYFNGSGITYIYAAFAEAPFVNSKGVPGNAR